MKIKKVLSLLIMFMAFLGVLRSEILKGRLLGIDPDGKIKMINDRGKTVHYDFNPFKIKIEEYIEPKKEDGKKDKNGKAKGYFKKATVFDLKIGDEIKLTLKKGKVVHLKFREAKESLLDFYFKKKEVKMYKGKYKNVFPERGILLLADNTQFVLTPYTHFIPYYGAFTMGDTIVIGYVEGVNGEKVAKWIKLRARK